MSVPSDISNQVVMLLDGSAAQPSVAAGNPCSGTGIYGTYGRLGFSINSSEKLVLDPNGLNIFGSLIMAAAGAPVNATTGATVAAKGSLYIDQTNANLYINQGTLNSPTWVLVGPPAA